MDKKVLSTYLKVSKHSLLSRSMCSCTKKNVDTEIKPNFEHFNLKLVEYYNISFRQYMSPYSVRTLLSITDNNKRFDAKKTIQGN